MTNKITVDVDAQTHASLKQLAMDDGVNLSVCAGEILEDFFEDEDLVQNPEDDEEDDNEEDN